MLHRLLFALDSERAHELALQAPIPAWLRHLTQVQDPVELFGVRFPNRVGLAAGFDKTGRFLAQAAGLGFGHLEVGTVTPRPQQGHERPRIWRHVEKRALRNRMGFPNEGAAALAARIARKPTIPLGVNLGKNATTPLEEAWKDYLLSFELLFPYADFFVVNVSSPNTAGLRELQRSLPAIFEPLEKANARLAEGLALKPRPILLKVSPDEETYDWVKEVPAAGLVATNTTVKDSPAGGISGGPLTQRAREVVAHLRGLCPEKPLIGVGGVMTVDDARALRQAGADLIQLYSGFIYGGPGFPRRVANGLKAYG